MFITKDVVKRILFILNYLFYLLIILIIFDIFIFRDFFGFGYPRHYEEENIQRYPAPYVMFTGKPNIQGLHNEFGFRGPSFKESASDDFRIAFFGGSTGYTGNPSIAKVAEKELNESLNVNVFLANYSVVSSNHRQHLHGIIEYLPRFRPDVVIFYGGYNELISPAYYDPRPGYPYNFFYREETGPFIKLLLKNSALIGEIDKRLGVFTGLRELRQIERPFSVRWNKSVAEKYFETLGLASKVTKTLKSKYCGSTRFLAFYQPFKVPARFVSTHESVRQRIDALTYAFDVSLEYRSLGNGVFADQVHVNQEAHVLMGKRIASIIVEELRAAGSLNGCHLQSSK